ncbi:MAG: VWA domain-containing protein [Bacteroidetes bacterium]|nr:VWA domain-containing protein [Bacteroidota bacterium]
MNTNTAFRIAVSVLLCVLLMPVAAQAQPDLNFKRVRLAWPNVEVYFSVGCNGIKNYQLKPSDVRLYEDGHEITDFGLWCPDPGSRCPISVGLVFDASDSMKGEGSEGAKHGGMTFIGNMDDVIDEASVIHFNQSVWVYQQMTTDTVALKQAVSLLPTFGATALWDGIFTALAIVQNNGHNQCRAVIVLSDGEDNSSTRHGLLDVITFAVTHNIRVFPIGYGENIAEDDLRLLAQMTGGEYYQTPNASELASIYREISTILYDYFQECLLMYEPRCGDDQPHEVELKVENLCGGDASLRRTYHAPRDSTTFREKHFGIGEATGMGGAEIRVPIDLRTPFFRERLYPMSITLNFDRKKLRLLRAETPSGTLLDGMALHTAELSDGGRIRIPFGRTLDGTGTLLYAVFGSNRHESDASYAIRSDDAVAEKGCIVPIVEQGTVHVTRSRAVPRCTVEMPAVLSWNSALHRYEPDPVTVRLDLSNDGTINAAVGTITLRYDPMVFELDEGAAVISMDTLHAGGQTSLLWKLIARPQASAGNSEVCIATQFEGTDETLCCGTVELPSAGMLLGCDLDLPAIQYQAAQRAFQPNPFDLRLHVGNAGVVASGQLQAMLQLPEGLYIESGEQYVKDLSESPLQPGSSTTVGWRLRLVSPLGDERLPVRVELHNDGGFYRSCSDTIVLPSIPSEFVPAVTAQGPTAFCTGDSVLLDAGAGYVAYRWNTGQRTRYLAVHTSGQYVATVRDAQGRVGQSDPVTVSVHASPQKPVISREGNVLRFEGEVEIQWFRNGQPVGGATGTQFTLTQTGVYKVRVRNAYGCESESDPFIVNVLSDYALPVPSAPALVVSPHPVRSLMQLTFYAVPGEEAMRLRIQDLLGRVVLERSIEGTQRATLMIETEGWTSGLYFISAVGARTVLGTTFLKQ